MKRLAFMALLLCLAASLAATAWFGRVVLHDARDNAAIRDLAAGRDAIPAVRADPRAIHARILFLAWRDRLPEAQDLLPLLVGAPPELLSEASYAIGNARMRAGFQQIEAGNFEDAETEISLAKTAYRDALRAVPGFRDGKVNLDLAMRLVRDLPRPLADGDSDPLTQPRRLWTDLPGLPRGAP
ncbi:hypothetical protein [Paracoccus sp. 22332]|uniref:hypothetical protein n=1 Tax=Paracoccus sp. 22332 TaxID=3453913 RepID=UPI003F837BA1